KAYAVIYNATYLGSGKESSNPDQDELFKIRENWGGEYANSIFGDYNGYGLDIEDKYSPTDSKDRLLAGEILFLNNIWFNLNSYSISDSVGKKNYVQSYLQDAANGNTEQDPQFFGISRAQDGVLDPRPEFNGPAYSNIAEYPTDIRRIDFSSRIPSEFSLLQNYPNPFNPVTNIRFDLPVAGGVRLSIYNILGQRVTTLVDRIHSAGSYVYQWNASNVPSGIYFVRLNVNGQTQIRKMMLVK
ncbi:MAG: T9SS type A sorting domain-containing protein, partial [Calditrichaeota bacterium]|nr:T9SS type A sorting domain-containing protein [Calditrichota bacterium]